MRNGIKTRLTASFFLAVPEAFSGQGIKGRLAVQVMPRETRFHMSGDCPTHRAKGIHPMAFDQRKMSCFT